MMSVYSRGFKVYHNVTKTLLSQNYAWSHREQHRIRIYMHVSTEVVSFWSEIYTHKLEVEGHFPEWGRGETAKRRRSETLKKRPLVERCGEGATLVCRLIWADLRELQLEELALYAECHYAGSHNFIEGISKWENPTSSRRGGSVWAPISGGVAQQPQLVSEN